jgi:hypothetical protein
VTSRPELVVFAGRHVLAGSRPTRAEYLGPDEHYPGGTLLVVSDDDPGPQVSSDDDFATLCMDCLLARWPEGEDALRIAREEGAWEA